MRIFSCCAIALSLLAGCDLGDSVDSGGLQVEFALFNIQGFQSEEFSLGDTINVHFRVTNTSSRAVTFSHTGPPVVLKIIRGDSVVASSVDGLMFVQVVQAGILEAGQSLTSDWRAPNTPWREHSIILQPGIYHAVVACAVFQRASSAQPAPVQFTVNPGNI